MTKEKLTGACSGYITPPALSSVFPAKAGTQIHPERLVDFTWTPAFAGETGNAMGDSAL
jgi:hypothetical protein